MMFNKTKCWVLFLVVISFACSSETKTKTEAAPESKVEEQSSSKTMINLDISELAKANQGDAIEVTLQDGSSYSMIIQRKEETMPGIVSISAIINNKETGLATLILRDNKLAGNVAMYEVGLSYSVSYDEESQQHYIIEVDPNEKDVLPGGDPLKAPKNNG